MKDLCKFPAQLLLPPVFEFSGERYYLGAEENGRTAALFYQSASSFAPVFYTEGISFGSAQRQMEALLKQEGILA